MLLRRSRSLRGGSRRPDPRSVLHGGATLVGMDKEPARLIGAIVAFVTALLGLLVTFGVDITKEQTGAILTVAGAGGAVLQAVWTRRKVTPA